ncbi:hypothetical protein [Brevundimonas sp. SORGH_AS_0993]|uniref:hypothetical protein n=1 Tax=Brevundimonas sp. SORGH_AS_0993 TaxID=3041794 RepID=UPI0027D84ACF|nr:hypothetical protein [Brevundimonas sp. SORGH_AS_0993]
MTEPYRIREAAIWAQARADYLSGLSAEAVCRRHDLGLSAFRRRARKYGWRRSDQVEPPPGELDLNLYSDIEMDDLAATARLRLAEAVENGRATEAQRWRRLAADLTRQARTFDEEFFQGMSREEILASLETMRREIAEEDEALLGPPPED